MGSRLNELKLKYQSALKIIQEKGVDLSHLHLQDDKLFLQGAAPSQKIKDEVWDAIKAADPAYGDIACNLCVDPNLPEPAPYQPPRSDSRWKFFRTVSLKEKQL